ncbi:MAG TPA: type IV pilus biogenesis/stability protein PilW [Rhodocyclaceae bacterium]|nr:type IV pilus biogenesis/stability protein PilW [Rhodocyclaceae bacterium]
MKLRLASFIVPAMLSGFWLQVGAQAPQVDVSNPGNNFQSGNSFQGNTNSRFAQPTVADPQTRARTHTELAAEYYRQGNYSVALDEIRISLEAVSNYVPAISVQGLIYLELKEFDRAEKELRRAMDLAPKDPGVMNNYGWFLCQTGKERQSISYFLDAIKHPLYPTPELAYFNAGTCAMKGGDFEGAESYLISALRLSRDDGIGPRKQLAQLSYRRGQFEVARRQVQELQKAMDVPSAELLWLALRVERKLGNRAAEGDLAVQLRNRYPTSREYQEFLKGNFE